MTRAARAFTIAIVSAVLVPAAQESLDAQQPPRPADGQPIRHRSRCPRPHRRSRARLLPVRLRRLAEEHPAPPDQPRYGRFDELQERNNDVLQATSSRTPRSPAARRRRTAEDRRLLRQLHGREGDRGQGRGAARRRTSPHRRDQRQDRHPGVVGHMHTVGIGFFAFGSAPDFKNATQYMPIVGKGGLGLPDRDYYFKDDDTSKKLREQYVKHVAKMFQLGGDPAAAAARREDRHADRDRAGEEARSKRRAAQPTKIYHPMSLRAAGADAGLQHDAVPQARRSAAGRQRQRRPARVLQGVDAVLAAAPVDDLKTYLRWHWSTPARHAAEAFVDENFAFYGKMLHGAKEQRPRWKRCVDSADSDLGEALGRPTSSGRSARKARSARSQMVEAIEAALRATSTRSPGCRTTTKKAARGQAARGRQQDRLPRKWRDYSALRIAAATPRQLAARQHVRATAGSWRRSASRSTRPSG